MIFNRKHLYIENSSEFSNIAIGSLVRAFNNIDVAYVDMSNSSKKITSFIEKIILKGSFAKTIRRKTDFFIFKKGYYEKLIIPDIEYQKVHNQMFIEELNKYELVILDNINDEIAEEELLSIINSLNVEAMLFAKNNKILKNHSDVFDLISEIKINANINHSDNYNKPITNIYGNGKGKTTYSLGLLLRNIINDKDARLITFDKGGKYYSEYFLLNEIRELSKFGKIKSSFDFIYTGASRMNSQTGNFRFNNIEDDFVEAKEGLSLLKTIVRKNFFVMVDELNTTLLTGLLKKEEILESLKKNNSQLLISGRIDENNSDNNLLDISDDIIEVKEVKHYFNDKRNSNKQGIKKGVDY